MSRRFERSRGPALLLLWFVLAGAAAAQVPSPREHFGFDIGDDFRLADYTQTEAYFRRLAAASDRLRVVEIGRTSEWRAHLMLLASSPANLARLEEYRRISERLARARDDEATARRLAASGRAVVWIDGGLHATETVGSHQLIETAWQLASRSDAETLRILDDTIVLLVHANPDGQELVADWYMREPVPEKRVLEPPPRLYQKYAGHDNNRDFYMAALEETRNLNRVAYAQWYPQIVYDHHQSAPRGTMIAIPPYRDPFNYRIDALVPVGLEALGAAINGRFVQEGRGGAVSKRGSVYSTWWNGGLRTTPYFHNMLGVLTEIAGSPTPMELPFLPSRQLPDSSLPLPAQAGRRHFRESIDYSLSANWALLDHASRHREQLLFNVWRMGRNSIERGSRDHWTPSPAALEAARAQARREAEAAGGKWNGELTPEQQRTLLQRPEQRDPRGYILPADQPDFATAVKFVDALLSSGVEVQQAERDFTVAGRRHPAGSYVVRTDQAYRAHVLDMFEPQDHPQDFEYDGGPPIAPYDLAGWTLAYQMGVSFDRVLDAFDGPFVPLAIGEARQHPPRLPLAASRVGWALDARANDSYMAANALLRAGVAVERDAAGRFLVAAAPAARTVLAGLTRGRGVQAQPLRQWPRQRTSLRAPRVALWDRYGGSMSSGWTRLVLESSGFDYEIVPPERIRSGGLNGRYDVLILPAGALQLPAALGPAADDDDAPTPRRPDPARIPAEYHALLGDLEDDAALQALRAFLEAGGHVVALGSSSGLALRLGLPITNHLTAADADGSRRPLSRREFYVPGSILEVTVETQRPVTRGMAPRLDVYYSGRRREDGPVFALPAGDAALRPILRFDSPQPLRSGWAWHQERLLGGVLAFEADVGRGRLTAFGSDITFRAQMHGGFKLLFNALLQAADGGEAVAAAAPAHAGSDP